MHQGAHIQSLIELLERICPFDYPADRIVHSFFKQRRYCGSKDRRQISSWLYRFLRHYGRLTEALGEVTQTFSPTLYALAYLKLVEHKTEEELLPLFNNTQYHPTYLSAYEKRIFEGLGHLPDAIECPDWLLPYIEEDYGDESPDLLNALNLEAPCDIRANILLTDRQHLRQELFLHDIGTEETSLSPWGLRLKERVTITDLELFKKGYFEIQDEGSQLIALRANPKPSDYVIDLCAGACGKTLAIAAMMQNKGRIVACDIDPHRLENGHKRLKRAKVNNVQLKLLDAQGSQWLKRQYGKVDIVLVDAPCTGTGTWRRNPDHKWRLKESDLVELERLQAELLDKAFKLVKKQGKIIYSTCSILTRENEKQVAAFLERHPSLKLDEEASLKLLPHKDGTDGFFCAVFVQRDISEDIQIETGKD